MGTKKREIERSQGRLKQLRERLGNTGNSGINGADGPYLQNWQSPPGIAILEARTPPNELRLPIA